jgi:agmatinase
MAADSSAFANPPSFMGVPLSRDLSASRAAVVGVPFDCGTHPVRIGSRLGPAAIREQSALVRRYEPPGDDFDPISALGLVDCGDAAVTPGEVLASYERIEAAIGHIVEAGAIPIVLGGDGAISLPHMRALHRRHDGVVVLHIDAHTDTYPSYGSGVRDRYNTATTFTRAAEEGVIDAAGSCHVGARGPVYTDGVFEFTRQQGYRLIPGEELFHRGFGDVVTELHRDLAQRPIYLCFDMDFFDPSCAPGVCTPTWGGASAREGLGLIRSLAGLHFVGFEVNTVSPPHDVGGMTAFLAAEVVRQFLLLASKSPEQHTAKQSVGT